MIILHRFETDQELNESTLERLFQVLCKIKKLI